MIFKIKFAVPFLLLAVFSMGCLTPSVSIAVNSAQKQSAYKKIIVLPFDVTYGKGDKDGTEEARFFEEQLLKAGYNVSSRNQLMKHFKKANLKIKGLEFTESLQKACIEAGVDAILIGSANRSLPFWSLKSQLIDVSNKNIVWSIDARNVNEQELAQELKNKMAKAGLPPKADTHK